MHAAAGRPWACTAQCLLVALAYVLSFHATKPATPAARNSDAEIKRRALCVLAACALAWIPLGLATTRSRGTEHGCGNLAMLELMGVHSRGVLSAAATAALLVLTFYGGVVLLEVVRIATARPPRGGGAFDDGDAHKTTAMHLRNLVIAPLAEEWAFRSCMLPLLRLHGRLSPWTSVFVAASIFAVAHGHHHVTYDTATRKLTVAYPATMALQMTYTTLFGAFAGALLLRTGTIAAPLAAHVMCNALGFPNFGAVVPDAARRPLAHRAALAVIALGIVAFAFAIGPATAPDALGADVRRRGACAAAYLWSA